MSGRPSVPPKPLPGEWALKAACRGMDASLFLPPDHTVVAPSAREACASCSVRQECLDYSVTPPVEAWGLWGGLGPKERRRYLREKRRAERGAA